VGPTLALLWELWRQRRWIIAAIIVLTVAGRIADLFEWPDGSLPVVELCAMGAFLLQLAVFNYTDSDGSRSLGRFPPRLFTLPLTSLQMVTVPMLAAIVSIELLYAAWWPPLSRDATVSAAYVVVLLAATMVFYLTATWTLASVEVIRLIALGFVVSAMFAAGLAPSFEPAPPPWWRTEMNLGLVIAALAVAAFLWSWRYVANSRGEGSTERLSIESLIGSMSRASARRRAAFTSPQAAHFWLEWRSSGFVLPAVVAAQLVLVILPASWMMRDDSAKTFNLFALVMVTPVLLAVPVGIAFSKPLFWRENLVLPSFIAVRPVSSEQLVAIKVMVAAASAALSWALVVAFAALWLPMWANLDSLSLLAIQFWALYGESTSAVYSIAALVLICGWFLTWGFLIGGLWSGMSGRKPLFVASVLATPVFGMAAFWFTTEGPDWLQGDPSRLAWIAWGAAAACIAKYWLAARAWRNASSRYVRAYLLAWLGGTASFVALALVISGVMRIYMAADVERIRSVAILLALLAMPIARIGLAPLTLAGNRHRLR
jgi:hypothetical protein